MSVKQMTPIGKPKSLPEYDAAIRSEFNIPETKRVLMSKQALDTASEYREEFKHLEIVTKLFDNMLQVSKQATDLLTYLLIDVSRGKPKPNSLESRVIDRAPRTNDSAAERIQDLQIGMLKNQFNEFSEKELIDWFDSYTSLSGIFAQSGFVFDEDSLRHYKECLDILGFKVNAAVNDKRPGLEEQLRGHSRLDAELEKLWLSKGLKSIVNYMVLSYSRPTYFSIHGVDTALFESYKETLIKEKPSDAVDCNMRVFQLLSESENFIMVCKGRFKIVLDQLSKIDTSLWWE